MGVSHRYRLLSVRGPRMVMRAAWGSLARRRLLVPYWTLARANPRLKHFAPPVATVRRRSTVLREAIGERLLRTRTWPGSTWSKTERAFSEV